MPKPCSPAILMIAYTNYETDPRVIRAAEAAAEAGFSVDFIALSRSGRASVETVRGVRVFRVAQQRYRARSRAGYIWAYLAFFLRCFALSTRLFISRRYRIVHVNNMPDALVFSVLIPRLFGARVILDIHDPMPETFSSKYTGANKSWPYRALLLVEKLSVAFASRTMTVNEPVRDSMAANHGYRREAIDVVANFADDRLFKPIEYPAIDDVVRFVFHGTILGRYGLKTLIEAVAKIRQTERVRVRIIGEGDFSATLKELIAAHGVEDRVEFINQFYPLHEIPKMLSDCHVGRAARRHANLRRGAAVEADRVHVPRPAFHHGHEHRDHPLPASRRMHVLSACRFERAGGPHRRRGGRLAEPGPIPASAAGGARAAVLDARKGTLRLDSA